MDPMDFLLNKLNWAPPGLLAWMDRRLKRIPAVRARLEQEYERLLDGMDADLHPYRDEFEAHRALPEEGLPQESVLEEMQALQERERERWQDGYVSGAVYHGEAGHIDFLNRVYALHSQSNPLHADLWPSAVKYEAEVVAMTAEMLGGGAVQAGEVCGTVTSGGTESILLAMKTYRDWAREKRGVRRPEIVVPVTAHAAFEKAAQYFGLKLIQIPVDRAFRADVSAARRALNRNTVALVGSAPSFPHGTIDPIEELSELARSHGVPFHTDACLGGFILPWARELGYPVPGFDFRLPGVTSISADTHKFGYAAKGSSVILYRGRELRRFQFYAAADWPGGLYFSPTFAGSRPGALIAQAWAALLATGRTGYLEATRSILETAARLRQAIESVSGLVVLGDPLWVIAFTSEVCDIFEVMDYMAQRGWNLNGLYRPPAVHICVTLRHTQPGVVERFSADLQWAVAQAREHPQQSEGLAPVYGLAARIPLRGMVGDLLKRYLDLLYRV